MGLKKFFIAFSLATIGGALTLRWLALDFLYANMPDFIPGIAGTLISSAALATSFSFVLYYWISKIEKVGKKVQKTGEVTERDKKTVLVFFKTLKSLKKTSPLLVLIIASAFVCGGAATPSIMPVNLCSNAFLFFTSPVLR